MKGLLDYLCFLGTKTPFSECAAPSWHDAKPAYPGLCFFLPANRRKPAHGSRVRFDSVATTRLRTPHGAIVSLSIENCGLVERE